ncbi:MAG: hypothetical protein AVDCRST_MAG47-3024, partial [uncultured Nocardioidaceae bacterium]
ADGTQEGGARAEVERGPRPRAPGRVQPAAVGGLGEGRRGAPAARRRAGGHPSGRHL